jgi:hypothetical protein
MSRPPIEVVDIFRRFGPAWRERNAGHVSLGQLKAMAAIEKCRTAALGGHVDRCDDCRFTRISYNSCGNRHCPKCQAVAAKEWLAEREAELLPVPYFHVVFTIPEPLNAVVYQNKATVYDILFKAAAQAVLIIAADPKRLGAKVGLTAVLHSWGSTMTFHPHVHMIVPGGGISLDGTRWLTSKQSFFLPVRVLGSLFRRLFLEKLRAAHERLQFLGDIAGLADPDSFIRFLKPLRQVNWVVYAKPPFGGPEQVLRYLARYTHRIAISNSRIVSVDNDAVRFRYKDHRQDGKVRIKVMTVTPAEFIRRFLLHVVPDGYHRIRHYGLLASGNKAKNLARARELLGVPPPAPRAKPEIVDEDGVIHEDTSTLPPCPCCGGRMAIIEWFERGCLPRHQPSPPKPRDTS